MVIVLTSTIAKAISRLGIFDVIIEDENLHGRHPLFWILGHHFRSSSLRWATCHKIDIYISCLRIRSLGCDYMAMLSRPSIAVAYECREDFSYFPITAKYQKRIEKQLYTDLLPSLSGTHQLEDLMAMMSLVSGCKTTFRVPSYHEIMPLLDFSIASHQLQMPYLVVIPGAGRPDREWPVEKFIEVARRFVGNVVVAGIKREFVLGEKIKSALGARVVNLCGATTIPQLGGVLARSQLVITNETGTATYAAILGVPTVCILGGGDFGAFFPNPYCPNTVSVYHKEDCYRCGWKCPKKRDANAVAPCIERITVDEVMNAAEKAIAADQREKYGRELPATGLPSTGTKKSRIKG